MMPRIMQAPAGRALLISMPLSAAHYPNLALGLLKPLLEAAGIGCGVRYFSLDYIDHLGAADYARITDPAFYMAHVGEWAFAPQANDSLARDDLSFLTEIFSRDFAEHHSAANLLAFLSAREGAGAFLDACFAAIDWTAYAVVGFTSSFQQTMAALGLARRIKAAHPDMLIVFGGANCQDEMGVALHEKYPFVDAVCLGEGERALPELVRRHLAGAPLAGIPGMVVCVDGATIAPTARPATFPLDALPYPDFDAFFAQHAASAAARQFPPAVVFETARGCWWGAKQHCTFCGLNGRDMAYRSKSQARAFDELLHLVARHDCRDVANADNILDLAYFREFIPRLAQADLGLLIYYEVKANLKPEQIAALARAGVRKIQAGIETLDSELLRLMRKGVTALQNVQTLKLGAEAGIYVEWLALCGFPGETAPQYDAIAALVPKLGHLQPPAAFLRARADRFSPYFDHPEQFGVTLGPLPAYRHIFPFDDMSLRRLGYHFDMHSDALAVWREATDTAAHAYAEWRTHQRKNALWCEDDGETMVIHEQRRGWPAQAHTLRGAEAALARFAWCIRGWPQIDAELGALHGRSALGTATAALEERGWLLREQSSVLMLPLRQPGWCRAPSWDEIRHAVGTKLRAAA
jgi:ribosomal peptide maturation radical SAM protein 1